MGACMSGMKAEAAGPLTPHVGHKLSCSSFRKAEGRQ